MDSKKEVVSDFSQVFRKLLVAEKQFSGYSNKKGIVEEEDYHIKVNFL